MIYIITNPELGWDCVCGVYEADSKQQVAEYYVKASSLKEDQTAEEWMEEYNYIIHETTLRKIN